MKRIAILGSTGSIGENALNIARHLSTEVKIVALAAKSNIDLLEKQAIEFSPELIAVYDKEKAFELQKRLPDTHVVAGMEGVKLVAAYEHADFVISAMAGTLGLVPTVAAIQAGKNIGLANKEALVSGGSLVMRLAKEKNVQIIPIDSEHSAIFQCLKDEKKESVQRLILTSSGGPFRNHSQLQLKAVTVDHALCHPTWKMGPKVTIDSSTLMNKGLEVIEAHWLFDIPLDNIEVVIHPQSIIHSLVEFIDGSMLAQMSAPSMMIPIQYSMTYPKRFSGLLPKFDFTKHASLQFSPPDLETFSCLKLAYYSAKQGGSFPCYMNAANEVLVNRFLDRQIGWSDIAYKLEQLLTKHAGEKVELLEEILAIDALARKEAKEI